MHLAEGVHDGHRGGSSVGVGGHDTDHAAVAGLQLSSNNTKNDIYSCTAPIREVEKRGIVNKLRHISARPCSQFSHCLNWGSMCRIPDAQSSRPSFPKVCLFFIHGRFSFPQQRKDFELSNAFSRFIYAFFLSPRLFRVPDAFSISQLPSIRFSILNLNEL